MKQIQRALISVYDKRGVVEFGRGLAALGIEIVSTGSTSAVLAGEGIPVRAVSEVTRFPEILDGRVKTLHPRIHAGILAIRDNPGHRSQLAEHGIETIDLVAVNLYPFAETIRRPGRTFGEVIENIDIGGPAMLRAAAKNFQDVAVVTDPDEYPVLLGEISAGPLRGDRLFGLALAAFRHTAAYDAQIADYLSRIRVRDAGFDLPDEPGANRVSPVTKRTEPTYNPGKQ
jgi:phosphoribosylaminoimidazolecarboxamide formyltransferase/IMP cyclohydrolase